MTRLFFSAGVARIVVLQRNSLTTRKSTGDHTAPSAISANRVERGSAVIRTRTKPSAESQTKNCDN